MIGELKSILTLHDSTKIIRRYFVVNGFDGALTMQGLMLGFHFSSALDYQAMISTSLSVAIALTMSGITSAYFSESAENKALLKETEDAMLVDLEKSGHGRAAQISPFVIALVNGLSPFFISLIIILPLMVNRLWPLEFISPIETAILFASIIVFLFGVFLGRISNVNWCWSGFRTLIVALVTTGLIFLVT